MKLEFSEWGGVAPRIDAKVLPPNMAADNKNINPLAFMLQPFNDVTDVSTLSSASPTTLFLYQSSPNLTWFEFDRKVDVVKAPIVNDPYNQVIICDTDEVKVTRDDIALTSAPYPAATYTLGLPQPSKPSAAATETTPPSDITDVDYYTISYVITLVDGWGRESAASEPSTSVVRFETSSKIQEVVVTLPSFNSDWDYPKTGRKYHIYRSASSGSEFAYLYVGSSTSTSFKDKIYTDALGEGLVSTTWFAPPSANSSDWPSGAMRNLCVAANSFLVGNSGNTVCYSESGVPHAFPPEYQKVLPSEVVALVPLGSDVIALTKGFPYLLSGTHPSVVAVMQISEPQSCVSSDSVVASRTAVFYASPDGLCVLQNSQVEVVTREILSQAQWQAMKPETLKGYYHEGLYYGKTDTHQFVINVGGNNRLMNYIDFPYQAAFSDLATDTLYVAKANKLKKWNNASTFMDGEYKTGIQRIPNHTNFGWLSVRALSYPVSVTVTAYDNLTSVKTHTASVKSSSPVPLPSGFRANGWQLALDVSDGVISAAIAHSPSELN